MLLHILLYASGVERNVMCSSEDVVHLAVIAVTHMYQKPCDAKRKKMRSSGQLFRACWPSSAEHTATSLSGITSL